MLTQLKSSFVKICQILTEHRSGPRRPSSAELTITWSDRRGRIVHGVARCLDISDSGARIEYHQAVARLTPIQVSAPDGGRVKTGKVSHCDPAGSVFHIGIQFC